jgi:hypothetical protein
MTIGHLLDEVNPNMDRAGGAGRCCLNEEARPGVRKKREYPFVSEYSRKTVF